MITMKDVLLEIFNNPTEKWPTNFRTFFWDLAYEYNYQNHNFNMVTTDADFRNYVLQAIESYSEWLNEANLMTIN
jgi:hypothetical protein